MPVSAGISDDRRAKTMRHRVDAAGADAAAGGQSGQKHAVDAQCGEGGGQRGTEKRAGILLGNHQFFCPWFQSGSKGSHRTPLDKMAQRRRLFEEATAVNGARVIGDVGQDHRYAGRSRRLAHAQRRGKGIFHIGIELASGIEIALAEVDHYQGRPMAKADLVIIGTAIIFEQIIFAHRAIFLCRISFPAEWPEGPDFASH